MGEQTTGRHLSRQPAAENAPRYGGGARPAGPVRPVQTARSGARTQSAETARRSAAPQGGGRAGGAGEPPRPERPDDRPVKRSPLDTLIRWLVLVMLLASMGALVSVLLKTEMLTGKYLILICALLLVLFAVVAVLVFAFGKNGLPWGGIIAAVLLSALMIVCSFLGAKGVTALQDITSHTYNTSHVVVYVREDDPAQALDEIAGYTFGTMEGVSVEETARAVADLESQLGASIQTVGYNAPTKLVSALFDGSVNAVITDVSYVDGLRELETYGELVKRMREITQMHVQVAVEATPKPLDTEQDDHVYTALITGIDSRNGLVRSSLSDVNILVTLNADTHQVLMVSTPRDYCVPFSNTGVEDKLTHAGWYGEEVCMATIGNIYDVDIDYYFRVNFEGFVNIIDALGGITVHSDYTFDTTYEAGYHFNEGDNQLNGAQALAFARERKAFQDGDEERGKHQMEVIRAVIRKVMSPDMLTRYSSVVDAVAGSFETTVPYDLIASLVRRQLDEGGQWNIVSYSVSGEGTNQVSPMLGVSVYMMIPDESTVQTAKDMIAQVFNGETLVGDSISVGT